MSNYKTEQFLNRVMNDLQSYLITSDPEWKRKMRFNLQAHTAYYLDQLPEFLSAPEWNNEEESEQP